jgi:hypothetical protein
MIEVASFRPDQSRAVARGRPFQPETVGHLFPRLLGTLQCRSALLQFLKPARAHGGYGTPGKLATPLFTFFLYESPYYTGTRTAQTQVRLPVISLRIPTPPHPLPRTRGRRLCPSYMLQNINADFLKKHWTPFHLLPANATIP